MAGGDGGWIEAPPAVRGAEPQWHCLQSQEHLSEAETALDVPEQEPASERHSHAVGVIDNGAQRPEGKAGVVASDGRNRTPWQDGTSELVVDSHSGYSVGA